MTLRGLRLDSSFFPLAAATEPPDIDRHNQFYSKCSRGRVVGRSFSSVGV